MLFRHENEISSHRKCNNSGAVQHYAEFLLEQPRVGVLIGPKGDNIRSSDFFGAFAPVVFNPFSTCEQIISQRAVSYF